MSVRDGWVGCLAGGALAVLASGCLLRDSTLVVDAAASSEDGRDAGTDAGASPKDAPSAGAAGGPNTDSASGGASGAQATGGQGGEPSPGTMGGGAPPDPDVCENSVCTDDYPCQKLDSGYTCRGQFADWSPAYSASAFTANSDTVMDTRSGLVWQQMVPASYVSACFGSKYGSDSPAGDACTWEHAKQYCAVLALAGGNWRLPTKAELESLVDDSRANPAIDPSAFPATPPDFFWSSSAYAGSSSGAWYVNFSNGGSYYHGTGGAYRVRCVR